MKKLLFLLVLLASPAWAAFPTVAGTAKTYIASSTTWACNLPASVAKGDLVLLFIVADSNVQFFSAFPGSWVELWDNDFTGGASGGAYLIASGGETTVTPVLDIGTADDAVCITYRITGWHGTTPPEAGIPTDGANPSSPDPPALTPSWGAADTLWIAVAGSGVCDSNNNDSLFTAAPTNYGSLVVQNGDAATVPNNCTSVAQPSIATATRELNAASDNPGTFTVSDTASTNSANLIAVRPTVVAGKTRPPVIVQ